MSNLAEENAGKVVKGRLQEGAGDVEMALMIHGGSWLSHELLASWIWSQQQSSTVLVFELLLVFFGAAGT